MSDFIWGMEDTVSAYIEESDYMCNIPCRNEEKYETITSVAEADKLPYPLFMDAVGNRVCDESGMGKTGTADC